MSDFRLDIRPAGDCEFDLCSFGEVMLRFDPGFGRVRNARSFNVWEGGGEYNVARAFRKCWGHRSTVVTALPRNDLGWLVEDLMMQGGVDQSNVIWRDFDGLGRNTRVGLNFTEKGFGVRAALGCSDRGNSAASQIVPGETDWDELFGKRGVRWLHTGGIFVALSEGTAQAVIEAVKAQLEQSAQQLEARKLALDEQRYMHEATMAAQDQTIKSREVGLAETAARQKADAEAIKGQMQDISAVQGALQDVGKMLQQLGQQHAQSHEAVMKGVLAKRTVQAVRGPDGRIAGATSMVEAG